MINDFGDIVGATGGERFLRELLGKGPLHVEGTPGKWAEVMTWPILNQILGITSIWSDSSLRLFMDKEPLPVPAYSAPAAGRDGGQVMRPDPVKVQELLAKGATLVLNDIDQLTAGLSSFSRIMEEALGGKVQANLYLSSKRRQGFRVHYDTHDVFAVHCMGEKTWGVYAGRAEDPIAHPYFKSQAQEHHEEAKGALWKEVRLKAGDLLYLPRGQYHYAIADDEPCCHIAFGVTYPIGLDVVGYLFERMVMEPIARGNLPRDPQALADRLMAIAGRAAAVLGDSTTRADITRQMAGFHYPRGTYSLPGVIEQAQTAGRWRVRAKDVRLVEANGKHGLVRGSSREAVEVPAHIKDMVGWVLQRESFAQVDLAAAFKDRSPAALQRFLDDMARMRLLESAA